MEKSQYYLWTISHSIFSKNYYDKFCFCFCFYYVLQKALSYYCEMKSMQGTKTSASAYVIPDGVWLDSQGGFSLFWTFIPYFIDSKTLSCIFAFLKLDDSLESKVCLSWFGSFYLSCIKYNEACRW